MTALERRHFLQLASLGLLDLAFGGPISCASVPAPERTTSPVDPGYLATSSGPKGKVVFCLRPDNESESRLRIFDWDDGTHRDVTVPMGVIHSVTQSEIDPSVVYLFELFGSAGRIDLKTGRFTKIDHRETKEFFNGHGAFSHSGEFVATTEIDRDKKGLVVLRSADDLQKVAVAPRECNNAHQVVTMPKSNLMAVGVMRDYDGVKETGAITFYDVETRKVANRIDLPYPVLHLMPLSPTEVVGVSLLSNLNKTDAEKLSTMSGASANIASFTRQLQFRPGPLFHVTTDGKTKTFWNEKDPSQFVYNFGLAKITPKRFFSGHHDSGKVILWNDFEIEKTLTLAQPKNILVSRDGKEFIVLSAERAVAFSTETFAPSRSFADWPDVVSFSGYSTT